ncbi:sulfotransferase family protein [Prosthecomicrobium sp. N25]|uniref:sulfotransferase family protein n=1 Tax=Prosthecomicrobium sp. N25 TaxID=3129254 RepID=UPI003076BA28
MSLAVIGAGVGRTGTYSLKLALEALGLGPCHHMEEVIKMPERQIPLWTRAVHGDADWGAIYDGYRSAVDWPTAGFWRELSAAYPDAKVILTTRNPDDWIASFEPTIQQLISGAFAVPPHMEPWLAMARGALARNGVTADLDRAGLRRAFEAHEAEVRASLPADRLLVYRVREGWGPLCAFLGVDVPDAPYPVSNSREEFWERIAKNA